MVISLKETFGALEIGTFLATFLFGVIVVQSHFYLTHFSEDNKIYKITVLGIVLLELAHTIGTAYEVYSNTITFINNPKFDNLPGICISTLMGAMITMIVQIYLSLRVNKALGKPWGYIGLVTVGLAVLRCVAAIFLVSQLLLTKDYIDISMKWGGLITGLLTGGAVIDVIIAGSMLHYLYMQKEKSFNKVKKLIDKLIIFTIRSGLLTSIAAVSVLILFRVLPRSMVWLAIYTCLAKLYTITFLSALNGRDELRKAIYSNSVSEPRTISNSPRDAIPMGRRFGGRARTAFVPGAISIEMKTTTDINIDVDSKSEHDTEKGSPTQRDNYIY